MTRPSQEDLLGYLLGALDAEQERAVQQSIDDNPDLERDLLELKSAIAPLELAKEPPQLRPGLARRTCEALAAVQSRHRFSPQHSTARYTTAADSTDLAPDPDATIHPSQGKQRLTQKMSPARDRLFVRSWSLNDFLVATACVAVLLGLIFPAISYTRYFSQRAECQSNLVSLGSALQQYSDMHAGQFVPIPTAGKLAVSGVFAPVLKESGLLPEDSLLACAGSGRTTPVHVPSTQAILESDGQRLAYLHQIMSGDYGYSLGYYDGDTYVSPRNRGRAHFVVIADRPSNRNVGFTSQNHRGVGQNCLFEDGHWEFVAGYSYGDDAIYTNRFNLVSAGADPNDIVIGASHCRPIFAYTAAQQ